MRIKGKARAIAERISQNPLVNREDVRRAVMRGMRAALVGCVRGTAAFSDDEELRTITTQELFDEIRKLLR